MNKRQSEILRTLFDEEGYVTLAYLAEQTGASVKTVRNDIACIREYLSEQGTGTLETKPHAGVRLTMTEEEWAQLRHSDDEEKKMVFFIIRHLLENGSLTAQKLAQQYYIGRTQLEKVLDKVAQWFFENRILYERRRGKGISIRYSEFNYRMARLTFFNESLSLYSEAGGAAGSRFSFLTADDQAAIAAALRGFDTDSVAAAILRAENEMGFRFTYSAGMGLLFLVSLCIMRSRAGFEAEMPKVQPCPADGEASQRLAAIMIEELEKTYGMHFSESETEFITFAAEISEIQSFESDASRRSFEAMSIELCRFTVKAVNLMSEVAAVNLREDNFYVKQMFLQLRVCIARLKHGIICKNRLLPQIKSKYPNMMAVAWFLGNIFEKELKLEMNEHEVGFLALHTGGAIERQLSEVTACVVCDYGVGISQILREKITRALPEIRITAQLSGRDIHRIKSEMCDFIIATTSLEGYRLSREVVAVGHLLDEKDIRRLEDEVRRIRAEKKVSVKKITPNTELFCRELIFPKCAAASKDELLHMICARMESLGYVTADFEKSVLEREKSTPTDIGRGVAIPHGLSEFVNHSAAAFASLATPIEWTENGDKVNMVFLLAFDLDESAEMKNEIIGFYKSIVSFTEDKTECERVAALEDSENIIKTLNLW